jgi:hypothetical protein
MDNTITYAKSFKRNNTFDLHEQCTQEIMFASERINEIKVPNTTPICRMVHFFIPLVHVNMEGKSMYVTSLAKG